MQQPPPRPGCSVLLDANRRGTAKLTLAMDKRSRRSGASPLTIIGECPSQRLHSPRSATMPGSPTPDDLVTEFSVNLPAVPKSVRWGLLAAGIVGVLLLWFIPEEYEAVAYLRVLGKRQPILGAAQHSETEKEYQTYKQTQKDFLTGPIVLNAAIRSREISQVPMIRDRDNEPEELVEWLMKKLEVEDSPDSQMLAVKLRGPDNEQPQRVVDAILDTYREEIVLAERREQLSMLTTLEQELLRNKQRLQEKQADFDRLSDGAERLTVESDTRKQALDTLRGIIHEAEIRLNELRLNLRKPDRVTVLQNAIVSESTNWKFKWLQIAGACFLVFGLTTVSTASWDYPAKLSLAITVVYLCGMALTWTLFVLGILEVEGPSIDDYLPVCHGMSVAGASVRVAAYWSGVWTIGYVLGLTAVALLKFNLKRD